MPTRLPVRALLLSLLVAPAVAIQHVGAADTPYLQPPPEIVAIVDAPPIPAVIVSPAHDRMALLERRMYPPIAELAQPMLRLAGVRVNPRNNGPHRTTGIHTIRLENIGDGSQLKVDSPAGAVLAPVGFSPDGKRFAFLAASDQTIALWVADAATGRAASTGSAAIDGLAIGGFNADPPCEWLGDSSALLCRTVPAGRGQPPAAPAVPTGPNVQENEGKPGPVRTYEDMLTSAHDEALFEYYFTSQLAVIDAATGAETPVGRPGIFEQSDVSPNGRFVLVTRIKRPFSRLVPASDFPADIEVWNRSGDRVRAIADVPLGDRVPIGGVITGPRDVEWNASAPATLVWAEALDGGDPKASVPERDRIMMLSAPFSSSPVQVAKTAYRFSRIDFTDKGVALLTETDRRTRTTRTWILDAPGAAPRKLWDRKTEDAYRNPGTPVTRGRTDGRIIQSGDWIYLEGVGSSPQGDHPFLDRLNLRTLATERLFRTDERSYETIVALLGDDGRSAITRYETPKDPPNYFVRDIAAGTRRALTAFRDPAPQLSGAQKQLITYTRKDGVELSGTLYLPPGYKPGERLPLIMWAYPREFTDPAVAGEVTGSPNRFTIVTGPSHLYLLLEGYAVLDNPTMPIVGPGETANDTYVEQLVASGQAAIDKVVQMGVADRDRIGIGGHSYGAFMTANLLAHSRLFRAGFAESGAYNRSLTPFGFQNERRTFWEVPQLYARMSPFWYANQVKDPILLMHGEADDNSGTFPIQSERFYMALKGFGATVRYVTLPDEAHGYAARETILHVIAEKIAWFDKYVKHAPPRSTSQQQ
ncbi:MAG: prolyl oligopeptidase family serine peptidase [Betaproteobacteria bacterium]